MTYEYVCTACQHEWEASQPISDPPLKECPKCGAQTAKRQVSGGTGFVLKGGGWYSDLYSSARPSGDSSKSSDTTTAKADAPKAESSESKAAPAKTETSSGSSGSSGSSSSSSTSS